MTKLLKYLPVLLPAGLFFAAVLLLVLLIGKIRQLKHTREELETQRERVTVRKQKIMEQKALIRDLYERLRTAESRTQQGFESVNAHACYDAVKPELNRLTEAVNSALPAGKERDALIERIRAIEQKLRVTLRIREETQEETSVLDSPDSEQKPAGIEGARVLFTDDNALILERCTEMLESAGFRVEKAMSGEEAVAKFRASKEGYYAIIFMDIVMDGMNGYDAAKEIRSMYRGDSDSVPIIAVTANSFSEDMVEIQKAGMNERIEKPVRQDRLLALMRKWLGAEESTEVRAEENGGWSSLSTEQMKGVSRLGSGASLFDELEKETPEQVSEQEEPEASEPEPAEDLSGYDVEMWEPAPEEQPAESPAPEPQQGIDLKRWGFEEVDEHPSRRPEQAAAEVTTTEVTTTGPLIAEETVPEPEGLSEPEHRPESEKKTRKNGKKAKKKDKKKAKKSKKAKAEDGVMIDGQLWHIVQ